ncbi:hypothetical protein YC2023_082998 [Brassica napus]
MVSLVGVCSALDSRSAPGELDSAVWGSLLEHRRDDFDLSSVCFDVGVDDLETCSILCFFSVTSSIEPCCELNSSFVRIGWRYLCFGVNASLLVDFRRSVSNSPGVGVVFIQLPAVLSRCSSYLEVIVDEFSLGNLVFGFGGLCFVHLLALGAVWRKEELSDDIGFLFGAFIGGRHVMVNREDDWRAHAHRSSQNEKRFLCPRKATCV